MNEYKFQEVTARLKLEDAGRLFSEVPIDKPWVAVDVLKPYMQELDREEVVVVNLDTHNRPINFHVVTVGDLDETMTPMQNVFKTAILSNADKVIVFHNHPSGSLQPSENDIMITQKLIAAGKLMNIEVLDHIIIAPGNDNFYSFKMATNLFDSDRILNSLVDGVSEEAGIYETKQNDQKPAVETKKASRKDSFRKAVAERFLKMLDSNDPIKSFGWIKNWRNNRGQQNLNSSRKYQGINKFVLMMEAYAKGYQDPRWVTFHGMKDFDGAYIKKGEHGTQVEYWMAAKAIPIYDEMTKKMKKFFTISEMNQFLKDHPEQAGEFNVFPKYTTVFNAEQCVGLPEYIEEVTNDEVTQHELVTKISESIGVKIINDPKEERCYYSPLEDTIHMPMPTDFTSDYTYNATALHELAHSTGAANRLDRNIQNFFGTSDYAFEELVAEMTSAMVATALPEEEKSIDDYLAKNAQNHQAYVQSWVNHIKEDPDVLPRALKLAELATDYMELHGGLMSLEEYNKLHQYEKPVIADEATGRLFVMSLQQDNILNCENKPDEFKTGTITPTLFPNQKIKNTTGMW